MSGTAAATRILAFAWHWRSDKAEHDVARPAQVEVSDQETVTLLGRTLPTRRVLARAGVVGVSPLRASVEADQRGAVGAGGAGSPRGFESRRS
jgi:hypothetical protein